MVRKIEIVIVLTSIVVLTLFSASFADHKSPHVPYDNDSGFYGRNILIEPETPSQVDISKDMDTFFWGVPGFDFF